MPGELKPVVRIADFATIQQFAVLSDDFNPIHVDRDFAAASPMKGIIAHGPFSTILVWQALAGTLGAAAAERTELELRFKKPVRENDTVTAGGRRRDAAAWEVWVTNQDGETVIEGTARIREA